MLELSRNENIAHLFINFNTKRKKYENNKNIQQ